MKHSEAGFTLMETLLSIAIILTTSCILVTAVTASIKTLSQTYAAINTTLSIARTDRFIRNKAGSLYIPYWANSQPCIDSFCDELYRSEIGDKIISVNVIRDSRCFYRGLEVIYSIGKKEIKTIALFPVIPVMEPVQ